MNTTLSIIRAATEIVDSFKFLGIITNLTWHLHVDELIKKVHQSIYLLGRRRFSMPTTILYHFYRQTKKSIATVHATEPGMATVVLMTT